MTGAQEIPGFRSLCHLEVFIMALSICWSILLKVFLFSYETF